MAETQGDFHDAPSYLGACSMCRYWAAPDYSGNAGSCRRYPPGPATPKSTLWALSQLVWLAAGKQSTPVDGNFDPDVQQSTDVDTTNFPPTDASDWCGEFVALAKDKP